MNVIKITMGLKLTEENDCLWDSDFPTIFRIYIISYHFQMACNNLVLVHDMSVIYLLSHPTCGNS